MKSPAMEMTLDQISQAVFGRSRSLAIATKTCVDCGLQADAFKDLKSADEYEISGLCQRCQDKIFGI